jgi:3-dehydroquinate synthase
MQLKASVVQQDERETDLRMHLNLGHTFAHAIEAVMPDTFQHGEAVALGLIAAATTGVAHGITPTDLPERIRTIMQRHLLPTSIDKDHSLTSFIDAMRSDKKRARNRLRLVLPTHIGACGVFDDVPDTAVKTGWLSIGVG